MENLIFLEKLNYNDKLYFITKFNQTNLISNSSLTKIIAHFSFKAINFDKKKSLLFLLLLELITNQKCCITRSKKNIIVMKIRTGSLTGCKVTLRKNNLYRFIDSIILSLPRLEDLSFLSLKKNRYIKGKTISFKFIDLFSFYQIEKLMVSYINKLELNWVFNTFIWQEKIFLLMSFYMPVSSLIQKFDRLDYNKNYQIKILKENFSFSNSNNLFNKLEINLSNKKSFNLYQNLFKFKIINFLLKEMNFVLIFFYESMDNTSRTKLKQFLYTKNLDSLIIPKKWFNLILINKEYANLKNVLAGNIILIFEKNNNIIDKNIIVDLNKFSKIYLFGLLWNKIFYKKKNVEKYITLPNNFKGIVLYNFQKTLLLLKKSLVFKYSEL